MLPADGAIDMNEHNPANHNADKVARLARVAFFIFLGIAAFFLITEHGAHLFGILPFLLLLACPLLHFGMHGRHGHGDGDARPGSAANDDARRRDGESGGGHQH